jgi:hypothetical protein
MKLRKRCLKKIQETKSCYSKEYLYFCEYFLHLLDIVMNLNS